MIKCRFVHALWLSLKFSLRTTSVNRNCSNVELIISQEGKSIEEKKTVCMRNTVFAGVWMCVHKLLFMTCCLCVHAQHVRTVYDVCLCVCRQYCCNVFVCPVCFMDGPVYGWPSCLTGWNGSSSVLLLDSLNIKPLFSLTHTWLSLSSLPLYIPGLQLWTGMNKIKKILFLSCN